MRIIKESENGKYAVVLLGGSIGERRISKLQQLTNKDIMDKELFSLDKAKKEAKLMNTYLSPGEKKYYGLKYVVAEVKNGKYTGN